MLGLIRLLLRGLCFRLHDVKHRWCLFEKTNPKSSILIRILIITVFLIYSLIVLLWRPPSNSMTIKVETLTTYQCTSGHCQRRLLKEGEVPRGEHECKMTCDSLGLLWPRPTGPVSLSKNLIHLYPNDVTFHLGSRVPPAPGKLLAIAQNIFKSYLQALHPDYNPNENPKPFENQKSSFGLDVRLSVSSPSVDINLETDESYSLHINSTLDNEMHIAYIDAETYFGARHGLETLSQMFGYDELRNSLLLHSTASVNDQPKYAHRGLLVDTSRNFMSLKSLRSVIDGMSYNKLNVFHWHITDTHSFPFVSEYVPELSKFGAYSSRKIYTKKEIQEFVEYARVRGVKVQPEFDAPAHVGHGWEFGPSQGLGNLAVCVNKMPWESYCVEPPCGQLNPINDKMYEVLGKLYLDFFEAFDSDVFHMGGDEINLECWSSTPEIADWLEKEGLNANESSLIGLWTTFQKKAQNLVYKANQGDKLPLILWTSRLTEQGEIDMYLSKEDYIIQLWTHKNDDSISDIVNKGFRTIFSNYDALYLDCGGSSWVGSGNNWCSPFKGWQIIYEHSPRKVYKRLPGYNEENEKSILGGEACLWSEQVDENELPIRLWPRGAALGERLWADPDTDWQDAESRMLSNRNRMVARGMQASIMKPEWCYQHEGKCKRISNE